VCSSDLCCIYWRMCTNHNSSPWSSRPRKKPTVTFQTWLFPRFPPRSVSILLLKLNPQWAGWHNSICWLYMMSKIFVPKFLIKCKQSFSTVQAFMWLIFFTSIQKHGGTKEKTKCHHPKHPQVRQWRLVRYAVVMLSFFWSSLMFDF